jgi:radical SAM protein with 4Fe4S-binding SPASM domain
MRLEFGGRPHVPHGDFAPPSAGGGGQFFSEHARLAAGRYRARLQIMFSEFARGELITISVRELPTGRILAEARLAADLSQRAPSDHIYLSFALEHETHVVFSGHVAAHCATTLFRYLTILDDIDGSDRASDFHFPIPAEPSVRMLKDVNFGTTGICNASCIHCPTNKKPFRMPHGTMSYELFAKIIDELASGGFTGEIRFGLFAEPLEDRFLVDRLKLIKKALPSCLIAIASNGALYNSDKHEEILDYVDHLSIHIEALTPEIYNRLMHPLKAERVIPKINAMIEAARTKNRNVVYATTPVHKENLGEVRDIASYFNDRQIHTDFTILSSRAWEGGLYPKLSLAPNGGICLPSAIIDTMFIDWDGMVLPCCFDFSKSMPLGNLNHQTFEEVFAGREWRAMFDTFRRGAWSSKEACGRCRADDAGAVAKIVDSLLATTHVQPKKLSALSFRVTPLGRRGVEGEITADFGAEDGAVVYGPYMRAERGSYRIYHDLRILDAADGSVLELDVCTGGRDRIAQTSVSVSSGASPRAQLDFEHTSDEVLEFRIFKVGRMSFEHRGATLVRI